MATQMRRSPLAEAREYLGLVRFSHTLFALPFALLGAALAAHGPGGWHGRPRDWVGILLCMATARTAAMAFNRLADRRFDALNPRTASRHLPSGRLSARSVAIFTAASSLAFVASTLLFLPNPWPIALSVPVLFWLLGYSYAKRFTWGAHAWLGVALSLAPGGAWLAMGARPGAGIVLLMAGVVTWLLGFDVLYSLQDEDFDRSEGLRSIPARFGKLRALAISAGAHVVTVLALAACGVALGRGPAYAIAVVVAAALLVYEHSLVRRKGLAAIDKAFFDVNAWVSVLFFVLVTVDEVVRRY